MKLKITYTLVAVLTAAILFLTPFSGGVAIGYAATSSVYSNVLDDLKKDSNFSESYYPEKTDDYSLQVIQIAESSDNELFVYVYQPSGQTKDFTASSINISTTRYDDLSYNNYKLEKCNSNGVFYKYVVKDFSFLSDSARYYLITSIYRPFDVNIDTPASGDNTISEVPYAVAKQYCFSEINGQLYVTAENLDTITITDKFVGFVRYELGGFLAITWPCDSHFVAFNTDKPIDKLLEADVYYVSQDYTCLCSGGSPRFDLPSDNKVTLKYTDDKVVVQGNGLFAPTYKWDTIETVEQFISENSEMENVYSGAIINVSQGTVITEEGKQNLQGKKWVLRFALTEYHYPVSPGPFIENLTVVGDVTILRLKFKTGTHTYNLGVIDNKQTGSQIPIGEGKLDVTLTPKGELWGKIFGLIGLVLLFVFLYPILIPVLSVVVNGILWLITAPFKALAKLLKKKKE